MTTPDTPDARCSRLAAWQRGLITTEQAERLGWTRNHRHARVASGLLVPLAPGLHRFAAAPVTWQQSALAACLAGPVGAVCSHMTAAALLGLTDAPVLPHVTVQPGSSARTRLAKVHRSLLAEADIVIASGIRCTGPGRTLLDVASMLTTTALEDMVDDVLCRPLTSIEAVQAAVDRRAGRGRAGSEAVRRALAPWLDGARPGSPAEMRLIRRIVSWGFPPPVRQHPVRDRNGRVFGYLDLAWPDRLRAMEYDGERWHGPRRTAADAERDRRLRALGWTVEHMDRFDLRSGEQRLHRVLTSWFASAVA